MSTHWQRIGISCLPIIVLLFLWEGTSRLALVNPLLFPSPIAVVRALGEIIVHGTLIWDVLISLWRVSAGLSIGVFFGIIIGLLTGRSPILSNVLSPLFHTLRSLPPVALIPLFIVWFGIDDTAKMLSIAVAAFFPVWLNTHSGAEHIAQEYLWSAKLLTTSMFTMFTYIIFPAALPSIITGIRTGIATAFIMVFVSELAGAQSGLGYFISIAQLAYRIDYMMAGLIILALLSMTYDYTLRVLIKQLCPWLSLKQ